MAARAYWQGQIRLALVSIPVEIYSAAKSGAAIAFHQIHEPSGKRIKYEKVVPGIGPVDTDEILKGFEFEKGNYVLLDQDEIDGVKLESKRTLELTQFVDKEDVDPIYFEKPYYVVPADDLAEEAFVVLREALRKTKKIGLGQLALRGREAVVSLKPCGRGMVLETLRYADELNKAQSYFRSIGDAKPDEDLLDLATNLIEKKAGKFEPEVFHDRYIDALRGLIDQKVKAKGRKIVQDAEEPAAPAKSNVIDLMAALKRSLEKPGADAEDAPAPKRAAARKPAAKAPARANDDEPAPKPAARKPAARKASPKSAPAAEEPAPAKRAPARKRA
jgi:DNA end-binding protein Ku